MRTQLSTQTALVGLTALLACAGVATAGPVLLNDPFNDGQISTNTGPGAVNPTASTGVWSGQVGGYSQHTEIINEANDAFTISSTADTTPYAVGQVSSRRAASYDVYTAQGTDFTYTLGNMQVAHANASPRPDIPGAGLGAIRYELGVVSTKDQNAGAVDELYRTNGAGGLFVSVYKDANGLVTGNLREVNDSKVKPTNADGYDSDGNVGLKTLASFTLPGFDGVAEFDVKLHLDANGYALTFDKPVTVNTGALTGTYGVREDGTTPWFNASSFDTGAYATVSGQNWGTDAAGSFAFGSGGYGSMDVYNVNIAAVPEPASLLGGATVAAGLLRRRR